MKKVIFLTGALCSGLVFMPLAVDAEEAAPMLSETQPMFRQIPAEALAASPKAEPTGQLYYDVTTCTDDPFSAPALNVWDCNCTQTNIYVDNTGFGPIQVTPVYAFLVNGEWTTFPWEQPASLDDEAQWVLWLTWPEPPPVTGATSYAAGVEYQGELFVNFVDYPLTINCP